MSKTIYDREFINNAADNEYGKSRQIRLCFVGNMLGRNAGYITTQGQILGDLFTRDGYTVIGASSEVNRVRRLLDIAHTIVLNHRRIDLLIAEVYSGQSFVIAETVSLLCRLLHIPLIFVLHGGNLPKFCGRFPHWTKRVLKRANRLVAPSTFLAKALESADLPIRVIPNVVDLDDYPCRIRSAITPKLFWMRSFHAIYNPQMAVEVLSALRADFPDAVLTMGGRDKGLEAEVKNLAKKLQVENAVRFPGFLDAAAKARELDCADIYLNTNRIDNMPVALIEAGAAGLAIVATAVGGVVHIIEDGTNGLLVPTGDIEKMTAAVKAVLRNPELSAKLSKNGRRLAEKSGWLAVKKDWEKLFEEALNKEYSYTRK